MRGFAGSGRGGAWGAKEDRSAETRSGPQEVLLSVSQNLNFADVNAKKRFDCAILFFEVSDFYFVRAAADRPSSCRSEVLC